ncbi:hypothetical protein SLS57_004743 [Botryosphaeria dothidea]
MHLTLKHYLLGLAVLGSLPSSTGRALPKTRRDALDPYLSHDIGTLLLPRSGIVGGSGGKSGGGVTSGWSSSSESGSSFGGGGDDGGSVHLGSDNKPTTSGWSSSSDEGASDGGGSVHLGSDHGAGSSNTGGKPSNEGGSGGGDTAHLGGNAKPQGEGGEAARTAPRMTASELVDFANNPDKRHVDYSEQLKNYDIIQTSEGKGPEHSPVMIEKLDLGKDFGPDTVWKTWTARSKKAAGKSQGIKNIMEMKFAVSKDEKTVAFVALERYKSEDRMRYNAKGEPQPDAKANSAPVWKLAFEAAQRSGVLPKDPSSTKFILGSQTIENIPLVNAMGTPKIHNGEIHSLTPTGEERAKFLSLAEKDNNQSYLMMVGHEDYFKGSKVESVSFWKSQIAAPHMYLALGPRVK